MIPEKQSLPFRYGLPIVDAGNVFAVLEQLGIKRWEKIGESIPLETYRQHALSPEEQRDLHFAPKIEVAIFRDPRGELFRGFRELGGAGSVVFTLLPDQLLVICGEFRHGCESISLNLPGGTLTNEQPIENASREFLEETGIQLERLEPLNHQGVPPDARKSSWRDFSFLGFAGNPVSFQEQQPGPGEFVQPLLIPLKDWLTLIDRDQTADGSSIVATLLALRKLGYAKV